VIIEKDYVFEKLLRLFIFPPDAVSVEDRMNNVAPDQEGNGSRLALLRAPGTASLTIVMIGCSRLESV
jgi:hypothetical protein